MKRVPPGLNLVRVCGLGLFYRVPRGFETPLVCLDGDHQKYLARKGYRVAPCPNVGVHGFDAGCSICEPFHGAIAVELAPEERARWQDAKLAELKAEHAHVGAQTVANYGREEWRRLTVLFHHLTREIRFYETPRPSTWGMCPWPTAPSRRVRRSASQKG